MAGPEPAQLWLQTTRLKEDLCVFMNVSALSAISPGHLLHVRGSLSLQSWKGMLTVDVRTGASNKQATDKTRAQP